MCTIVVLRRPDHRWPLILAANRDEMADRPWQAPGRHWPDRAHVVAGRDVLAGGSWLGINDAGLVAGVLNRRDSLGPDPRLRSRGELVLEALDHADAPAAAEALGDIDPGAYRSFNMILADWRDAYWLRGLGPAAGRAVEVRPLPEGLSMLAADELNDPASPRIRHFRPAFEAAAPPEPEAGAWSDWEALLARRDAPAGADQSEAMAVVTARGFGTLSSSLIALAAPGAPEPHRIWRFCAGRPGEAAYREVAL